MVENYNMFELAGYTKEESEKLIKICHERDINEIELLKTLNTFGGDSFEDIRKELYRISTLEARWYSFTSAMAKLLKIYEILDWLNEMICKTLDWLNEKLNK